MAMFKALAHGHAKNAQQSVNNTNMQQQHLGSFQVFDELSGIAEVAENMRER